jgi:hypothetical protein
VAEVSVIVTQASRRRRSAFMIFVDPPSRAKESSAAFAWSQCYF